MSNRMKLPGEKTNFKAEQKQALRIAKDLYYGSAILEMIQSATTSIQLTNALRMGRLGRLS